MHPIFCITSSDIKALNDGQARELVARLCKAELLSKGFSTDAVTWGGDQKAKDGGVDVRVELTEEGIDAGYIPKCTTLYQVKAENFPGAKIIAEMEPKGVLRPVIRDLAEKTGAYVLVSTRDDFSDLSLLQRRRVMLDCLLRNGLGESIYVDFYDSRKIADWVENYPAIVAWIKAVLGKAIHGWRPYGPWAYREENLNGEYLLDEKLKVSVPHSDSKISAIEVINRLRLDLSKPKSSIRIVGLSGVGKTRLVQALFDSRVKTENQSLDQQSVLYTDLADNPSPQPSEMLEALISQNSRSIVIVDNCGQDVHKRLSEIVHRANSNLRLVTIEYDIRDNLPEETACYQLEGASDDIISKLLARHFQTLSEPEVERIVEFSDGNARVAFALASTSENSGELARLRDVDLFKRLFIQKQTESNELERCAQTASLLYSFDGEDVSKDSELALLADYAEVSISNFYQNIKELQNRGLVQRRGKWRAVLPHAISNRLALNAVESNHPDFLVQRFISDASERVMRSFSRRLGYLHESKHAQEIVEGWLKPEGLLGDFISLSDLKREMFENVSPVNQRAALNALLRAIMSPDFVSVSNSARKQFALLLRSLAYESSLFDDAASALVKLVLLKNDTGISGGVSEILQSLFHMYLSGTLAPAHQRAAFVKELGLSGDSQSQILASVLISAGLKTDNFLSAYNFKFGALKREYGWHPKSSTEIRNWFDAFVELAIDLGKAETSLGAETRSILGKAFAGLWHVGGMDELLITAAREFAAIDGWPEGWIGVRKALHWDRGRLSPDLLEKLKILEKEISPKDLKAQIHAKVLTKGTFNVYLGDAEKPSSTDSYDRIFEDVRKLGEAAAHDLSLLADLEPFILTRNIDSHKIWYFANGLGESLTSVRELLDRLKLIIENSTETEINFQFIRGLINGWNKVRADEVTAFLNDALEDEAWRKIFPELQFSIDLDESGYARLFRSLQLGVAPCRSYVYLGFGSRTDFLTVHQISSLLGLLVSRYEDGANAAIDVLDMVIHLANSKDEQYKKELGAYCLHFLRELKWDSVDLNSDRSHRELTRIIEYSCDGEGARKIVVEVLTRLMQQICEESKIFPGFIGELFLPFFKKFPLDSLDAIYTNAEYSGLSYMLAFRLGTHRNTVIGVVPRDVLIEWCSVSPGDRCLFAAQTCRVFEMPDSGDSNDLTITGLSNTAKDLLALAPDRKKVLEILVDRFSPDSWSGSRAAIMRQRYQFLDDFNRNGDTEIASLIDAMKPRLEMLVAAEERDEQERERSMTGRFE